MSSFTRPIAVPSYARSASIAALLGATILASPLGAAHAGTVANGAIQLAQAATPAAAVTETKGESVEQRITTLHASLKITADEEKSWNGVAQAMRENAAAMDKLIAANRTAPPHNMSAVDDLKTYQQFAQAHVDGLKNLTSAFSTLYDAMPDPQKKIADEVFRTSGNGTAATHG